MVFPSPSSQQQPSSLEGSTTLSPTTYGLMAADLLSSVLGATIRLYFISWLAKKFASVEEVLHPTQHFVWESMNDRFVRDARALDTALSRPPEGIKPFAWKQGHVWRVQGRRPKPITDMTRTYTRTAVVIELKSEPKLDVEHLSNVITFLLQQYESLAFGVVKNRSRKERGKITPMELEVIFLVDSPGGEVGEFGLAAAQMQRLAKTPGITTTVCVDRVAASGGYMIGSQADRLYAAPFATVGSIGVTTGDLNFHNLAKNYDIQPIIIKSGKHKNPLSTFGKVTEDEIAHETERVEQIHDAFKTLVVAGRQCLSETIGEVSEGDTWLGVEAVKLGLIDAVLTSNEYIFDRIRAGDRVLKLHRATMSRFRVPIIPHQDLLPQFFQKLQKLHGKVDFEAWFRRLVQMGGMVGFVNYMARHYSQYN